MRLSEALIAPSNFDARARVVTIPRDKTTKAPNAPPVRVPVPSRAVRALSVPIAHVSANEASALFARLTDSLLIEGLTFHDARASALTWLSRRVDVLTLSRISGHKDLKVLMGTYYRESAEEIARRL